MGHDEAVPKHPYPLGWFVVAFSEELAVGDVVARRYFGRDLVLFRSDSGTPVVLDAHCPHLGAHLGVGGRVVGESIRCPFHAWRFGADGGCVEVPYSKRIPKAARSRAYPVAEKNGVVMMHYAHDGRAPTYEIPVLAEYGAPGWSAWTHRTLRVRTQPREIVENVVDLAHFPVVHRNRIDTFENEFVGERAIQRATGGGVPDGPHTSAEFDYRSEAVYYGPGYQITAMHHRIASILLNAHTPIDTHEVELRFAMSIQVDGAPAKVARIADAYVEDIALGFGKDVAIWEHKRWRDRPALVAEDGPIGELRRWYEQFYVEESSSLG